MIIDDPAIYTVKPVLVARKCGGWLATTPNGWPLCIGVTAETAEGAEQEFSAALSRWAAIPLSLTDQACGT